MVKILLIVAPIALLVIWTTVMSRLSAQRLKARSRLLKNDQLERALRRLAETAGVEHISVRVLDEPMINGLVTPTGDIFVTRGLIDAVRGGRITPPEFASVVAHELGHMALGHTRRRTLDVAIAQAVHTVVGGLLARLIPVIGWYLARLLSMVFVTTLSRKDEFEADRYATALMIRSGLGAEPQARMLEKLLDLTPGADALEGPAGWLASHPPVRQRAEAIRENARRWADAAG